MKKHDYQYCPECKASLEGYEEFCQNCGFKLVGTTDKKENSAEKKEAPATNPAPPPPPADKPKNFTKEPSNEAKYKRSGSKVAPGQKNKKNNSTLIIIIAAVIVVLGVGGYFLYTKVLNKKPVAVSNNSATDNANVSQKYFFSYAMASVDGKQTIMTSSIFITSDKNITNQSIKNKFKEAAGKKYPAQSFKFNPVIVRSFNSFDEANSESGKIKDEYKGKGYQLWPLKIE